MKFISLRTPPQILNMAQGAWGTKILIILVIMHLAHGVSKCGDKMSQVGYTEPAGDITVEAGSPLNITCVLDNKTYTGPALHPSKNMFFERKDLNMRLKTTIMDDYSIQLYIPKMERLEQSFVWFDCNYRNEDNSVNFICHNAIFVGTKPQDVEDFTCISYNLENLTCTWTPPDNGIKTQYFLSYSIPNARSVRYSAECPDLKGDSAKMSCVWTINSVPHYRQAIQTYSFLLKTSNSLGNNSFSTTFDHYKYVIPAPPEDLRGINSTTNSIFLSFKIPNTLSALLYGLECRLFYQCLRGPKEWKKVTFLLATSNISVHYNLTNLEIAGVLCDIRVSLRSRKSNDEKMWSNNATLTYATAKTVPGAPPKVNIGSFQIDSNNVYLYWQQIPEALQNGGNFTYVAKAVNYDSDGVALVEIKESYAKFTNLSFGKEYKFAIWSRNEIGDSVNKSFITIPSLSDRPKPVDSFKKLARKNGTYQVHIQRSAHEEADEHYKEIKSYTIFWCENQKDRPFQCMGFLNWTEVSIDTKNFTVDSLNSTNFIWQFAISVNTERYSSGMVWAICTVLDDQRLGKIKHLSKIGDKSNSIHLSWNLNCPDAIPTIDGFVIYYCPIASPKTQTCKEDEYNVTIYGNSDTTQGYVEGLKPYTTYRFSVAIRNKSGDIGEQSDPVLGTTLESAPTPPVNLTVDYNSITSTSAKLSWQPPEEMNGALKYYQLMYDNATVMIDPQPNPEYTITNLEGYKNYTVYIQACTTACSTKSNTVEFLTKIGVPVEISRPKIDQQNSSHILITWRKPLQPKGPIDYYQIKMRHKMNIFNWTSNMYPLNCEEEGKINTIYFAVRAVNIAHNKELTAPWSDDLECYCSSPEKVLFWIFTGLGVFVIILLAIFLKKVFVYCKVMKNVELKLPPGLAQHADSWVSPKGQGEPEHSPPDEVHLLKIKENRIPSGDSSGCCSGHGSVASDSGTTISGGNSDSGTEQNELRKRAKNPGPMKLPTNNPYISMPVEGVKQPRAKPPPGNYCVFGVDPSTPGEAANAYLSPTPQPPVKLPFNPIDTLTPSTPYVATGDLNKPNNSGYVPRICAETPEKNPPYVFAGTRNVLIPEPSEIPEENKSIYLQASDATTKNVSEVNPWQQQMETTVPKGYVTVGEPLPKRVVETKKGYVPHSRHFDTKLLKED